MDDIKKEIMIIDEKMFKDLVYEIRGQKVMLDSDLAKLYGYTTKAFNQQIKNNKAKFDNDFMFQINKTEVDAILRSKILTANTISSKRRYFSYAFTEQGIYMLMTVLKGEVAVEQSKALIRLFKTMKDYLVETDNLITTNEVLRLSRQVNQNTEKIGVIESKLDLVMDNFIDPSKYKQFVIANGQRIEADVAYQQIYSLAKQSLIIIDDYISIKTLQLLKACSKEIRIIICSDNVARNKINEKELNDFIIDTGINISLQPTNSKVHDRYIVVDYKSDKEIIYHSGCSSKDSGDRLTTIMEVENPKDYHRFIDEILKK